MPNDETIFSAVGDVLALKRFLVQSLDTAQTKPHVDTHRSINPAQEKYPMSIRISFYIKVEKCFSPSFDEDKCLSALARLLFDSYYAAVRKAFDVEIMTCAVLQPWYDAARDTPRRATRRFSIFVGVRTR